MTTPTDRDNIEKWIVLAGLQGVAIADLWDSEDEQAEDVFNHLESLEEIEEHRKENEAAFKVAQSAVKMGITTSMLWAHHEYQLDLAHQEKQRLLQEDEDNNPMIKALKEVHLFQGPVRKTDRTITWTFEADLGDGGFFKYTARKVSLNWLRDRFWLEWRDSLGKKHSRKEEIQGSSAWQADHRWPRAWQEQYGRYLNNTQITYAYTQSKIDQEVIRAAKRKPRKKKDQSQVSTA